MHPNIRIGLASDHAGFSFKQDIMNWLAQQNLPARDFGCFSDESCDYADFAHPLAQTVAEGTIERGIVICGSGNGVAITANKYRNVRCALVWEMELARLARAHGDANVLAIPAKYVSLELAVAMADTFLSTAFEGGRHQRRIDKIEQ